MASEQLLPRKQRLLKRFSAGDGKSVERETEMGQWRIIQSGFDFPHLNNYRKTTPPIKKKTEEGEKLQEAHLKLGDVPTHSSQVTSLCPLMSHSGWVEIGNCSPPPHGGGPSET